jgi:hypothetical protein
VISCALMRDALIVVLLVAVGILGFLQHSQNAAMIDQQKQLHELAAKVDGQIAEAKRLAREWKPREASGITNAHFESPAELWDAMLGGPKQSGHVFSQSGPSSFSFVDMKGTVSRLEPAQDGASPALIFDVSRDSVWNGITLHGSVHAAIEAADPETYQHFSVGQEIELTCQVGAALMPFVYLLNCRPSGR